MSNRILVRYLIRQNLFYLALVFGAGIGIYVLIELFDRLDDFLKANVDGPTIVWYFVAKTPLIVSQIFPAVFLLALLVQFSLMHRNREIIALASCAVPFARIGRIVLVYALVWTGILFLFSQILGTAGYDTAHRIWKEEVRKKQLSRQVVHDLWFREGREIIHVKRFQPITGKGRGVVVSTLSVDGDGVERIVEADFVNVVDRTWRLRGVELIQLKTFMRERKRRLDLELAVDPRSFVTLEREKAPQYLSYWRLAGIVKGLGETGSNVEGLATALYSKLSYPFSLVVMGGVAILLTLAISNIYGCVLAGLLCIFVYYVAFVLATAAGESGMLPPMLAAWAANMGFGGGLVSVFGLLQWRRRL
ncbi:LptF/LptG family permease [Desulfoplanes sp.]